MAEEPKDNLELWQAKYPNYTATFHSKNTKLDTYEYTAGCPICKKGNDRVSIFAGLGHTVAICRDKDQGRNGCGKRWLRSEFNAITPVKPTVKNISNAEKKYPNCSNAKIEYHHKQIYLPANAKVLAYAKQRGFTNQDISNFKLGAIDYNNCGKGLTFPIPYAGGIVLQTRLLNPTKNKEGKEVDKYRNQTGDLPICLVQKGSTKLFICEGVVDGFLAASILGFDSLIMLGKKQPEELAPFCKEYKTIIFAADSDFLEKEDFVKDLWKLTGKEVVLSDAAALETKDFAEFIEKNSRNDFKVLFSHFLTEDKRTPTIEENKPLESEYESQNQEQEDDEPPIPYLYLKDLEKAKKEIEKFKSAEIIALDTETRPLPEFLKDKGAGLRIGKNKIRLVQLYTPETGVVIFDMMTIKDFSIFKVLEDRKFCLHNALFDLELLQREGINLTKFFDSMIFAGVALPPPKFEGDRKAGLKPLAVAWLGEKNYSDKHVGWDKEELPEDKLQYAAKDAKFTYELYQYAKKNFSKEVWSYYLFFMKAFPAVFDLLKRGVRIDLGKLSAVLKEKTDNTKKIEEEIGINLNSSPQIDTFFKDKYPKTYEEAIEKKLYTPKTQKLSIADKVLNLFCQILEKEDRNLAGKIRQHAASNKIQKSLKQYKEFCCPDFKIRTSLGLAATVTGRFNSSKPNMQNIKKDEKGAESVRRLFQPEAKKMFVLADFRQQEIRAFALLAKDSQLIKAIDDNLDIHAFVASKAFDVEYAGKETKHRTEAKAITFGVLYGGGEGLLAEKLSISKTEARKLRNKVLEIFPSMKKLRKKLEREWLYNKRIPIAYPTGWRYLFDQNNQAGSHKLINYTVQGSCGSVMINAMALWYEKYSKEKDCRICNSIHDELIFEVDEEATGKWIPRIEQVMEQAFIEVLPEGKRWQGKLLDITVSRSFSKQDKIQTEVLV